MKCHSFHFTSVSAPSTRYWRIIWLALWMDSLPTTKMLSWPSKISHFKNYYEGYVRLSRFLKLLKQSWSQITFAVGWRSTWGQVGAYSLLAWTLFQTVLQGVLISWQRSEDWGTAAFCFLDIDRTGDGWYRLFKWSSIVFLAWILWFWYISVAAINSWICISLLCSKSLFLSRHSNKCFHHHHTLYVFYWQTAFDNLEFLLHYSSCFSENIPLTGWCVTSRRRSSR